MAGFPLAAAAFRGLSLRYEVRPRQADPGSSIGALPWSEPDLVWLNGGAIPVPAGLGGHLAPIEVALLLRRRAAIAALPSP